MTTKKTTDLKSVSLGQIRELETKTVVGGSGATASASRASKAKVDDAKLAKDRDKQTGRDGSSPTDAKDKSDQAKTSKDMIKVARDA